MDAVRELAREIADLRRRIDRLSGSPQLAHSSIEDGGINEFYTTVDAPEGVIGSRTGRHFDGTHGSTSLNGPIPPTPTTAAIEQYPGGFIARWDGLWRDGAFTPLDFTRVEIHASTNPLFTGLLFETLRATIESPRGGEVAVGTLPDPGADPYYVKLVARSASGGTSAASELSAPIAWLPPADGPVGDLESRVTDAELDIIDLETDKADIASPTFTGVVIIPDLNLMPGTGSDGDVLKLADHLTGEVIWAAGSGGGGGSADMVITPHASTVTFDAGGIPDDLPAATTSDAGALTAADKTKLDGIATGATANDTDANLKARANHTGFQTSSTISDFAEAVQDTVAALLTHAGNIALSYDDVAGTLEISTDAADPEEVRDLIGVALIGTGLIAVSVNDALDTITISTSATANDTDANLKARGNHTGTQLSTTISDFATAVGTLLTAAIGVTVQGWGQQLEDIKTATFANDDVVQKKAGNLKGRSIPQLLTDLVASGALSTTSTSTVTNKRIQPPITSGTVIALNTLTPDFSVARDYLYSGITAAFTIANPTGTPVTHERLRLWLRSSAGTARNITYGGKLVTAASGGPTQATATPASATVWLYQEYVYNATLDKHVLVIQITI